MSVTVLRETRAGDGRVALPAATPCCGRKVNLVGVGMSWSRTKKCKACGRLWKVHLMVSGPPEDGLSEVQASWRSELRFD